MPEPASTPNLKDQTIADFGEQWTAFRENPDYYGSAELLADLFGPLLSLDDIKGKTVADIGSGTGRIVNMLLDVGASRVIAVEPSAAMRVLKENTIARADKIEYLALAGDQLPSDLDLDCVVSMGVLHHIPDPAPVVRAAFKALRAGGRCIVWLYGYEGNETYLSLALPLRKVTVLLPHKMLVALSYILEIALTTYIGLCRIFPLPMRSYMRGVLAKFTREVRRLTIYDQLNPAYAKYYTRAEAEALLSEGGFADVQLYHRHGYSWTVSGVKPT
ncbi:class I SAM-dependent methyltransferase [Bradyrhizobium canariense]|uniref:Methyltransferase domain-containing protein n=1 Tax=Bradyrhizobium canariense TaxID=255045 RepID=A0A1H1PFC1_9BRAD|nr:class I SAM-dependent methyltransferase [Bradyrhizobium canariense]SDS09803.1 Methyltransferase domain-containing protein [Bradyrhizobium canariense]